jgi:cytochrome b
MPQGAPHKVRIWDLPTRCFHWGLAIAAVGLLVTGKMGGDVMVWHARLGYCVGTLIMFRLLWGWLGGYWSRFAAFAIAPRAAWRYLRGSAHAGAGHNPLGALSVYAMLGFLALQVASGLFSETKDDFAGPLSTLASNAVVHFLTGYHRKVGQWVLIALVVLHLAAVAYYTWRGDKLLGAMWSGDKTLSEPVEPSKDDASSRFRALALLALCAVGIWGLIRLGG